MLKLQEIQHYNGLKFMVTGSQRKNILMSKSKGDGKYQLNTVYSLHGINKWHVIPTESLDPDSNLTSIGIKYIKPILFPLSSLVEEIEVGGKRFVPSDELCDWDDDFEMWNYALPIMYWENMIKLFEWKIDVFNLIGQGKAVSVLDFDVNPYK